MSTTLVEKTRVTVLMPVECVRTAYIETAAGRADWLAAKLAAELQPCLKCNEVGHWITCQAAPHPGENPPPGVITDLVQCCSCCMFGPVGKPERGYYARLTRERADDRDITVEVLSPEGKWLS